MPKLTKRAIDAIRLNSSRDVFAWDSELPGFGVRVKSSGAVSFILQYPEQARAQPPLHIRALWHSDPR